MTDTKTSAQTLRDAAALMRERARDATPEPWKPDAWYVVGQVPGGRPGGEVIAQARNTVGSLTDHAQHRADALHIAAFASPTVALAVADWLDATAREFDALNIGALDGHPLDGRRTAALAVARAYMGAS